MQNSDSSLLIDLDGFILSTLIPAKHQVLPSLCLDNRQLSRVLSSAKINLLLVPLGEGRSGGGGGERNSGISVGIQRMLHDKGQGAKAIDSGLLKGSEWPVIAKKLHFSSLSG